MHTDPLRARAKTLAAATLPPELAQCFSAEIDAGVFDFHMHLMQGAAFITANARSADRGLLAMIEEWRGAFPIPRGPEFLRPDVSPADATPLGDDRRGFSDQMALLNRASRYWWANADKNDPGTHPKNSDVASWLIERGMTKSLADRAASIIRPEWAHTGRKPDA